MDTQTLPAYVGMVAMLPVSDVSRSIAFYEQLGFAIGNTHADDDAGPNWAWLHSGGAHLMLNRSPAPVQATHNTVSMWLYSSDVKATHAALAARGLDVGDIDFPFYNPRGEFHVHDPDGYPVFIAQAE